MLEATLPQGVILKKIIESIKELVEDANFECSKSGITLQAMDQSHVALVHLMLKKDLFSNYRCDRNFSLGLNLKNMSKMLKCAANDDSITIKAEEEGSTATFIFSQEKKKKTSQFEIKLTSIENEDRNIPEADHSASVQMNSAEFQKIIKDLDTIGDTITITVTKGGVKFSVQGEIGSASVNVGENSSADNDDSTVIDVKEPVSLTFANKFLMNFTKSTSLSDNVTLQLSKEMPLVVGYKFNNDGYIRYYLAPKLDDEEGEKVEKQEPVDEDDD